MDSCNKKYFIYHIKKLYNKICYTDLVISIFAIMILGPYFKIEKLPLRIDHFLFPLIFLYALIIDCNLEKKIKLPKALQFYILFIFINLISTVIALYKGGFFLSLVPFLGLLDSHVRIFVVLYSIHVFSNTYEVNFERLINSLMFFSLIIAFFAIFQVYGGIKWANKLAAWISVNFYVGRFSREKTIVHLCLNVRSFATFFSPSNFSLFSMLIFLILMYMRKFFKENLVVFAFVIYFILLGWGLSISKGFVAGVILCLAFLCYKRKWKEFLLIIIILLPLWQSIKTISSYAEICYLANVKPKSIEQFYNRYFGPRFGYLITKGKTVRFETSVLDITEENNKNELPQYEKSEALSFISGKKNDKKFFLKGYLDKSIEVFKKNWILGVGYSSNVSSGDSMFVNLFITGGVIGTLLFIIFFIHFLKILYFKYQTYNEYNKNLSEIWMFSAVCFFIFGVLLPTFIQDRTSDIFWILGGLLAFKKK